MRKRFLLIAAAGMMGLCGCVVHDGNADPEPIWWPTFVMRESTAPHLLNYTSPGPGDQAAGQPRVAYDPQSVFPGEPPKPERN